MDSTNAKAAVLQAITVMAEDQPASWGGPTYWQGIANACAGLIVELHEALEPAQLAQLMWCGASAVRQAEADRTGTVEVDRG